MTLARNPSPGPVPGQPRSGPELSDEQRTDVATLVDGARAAEPIQTLGGWTSIAPPGATRRPVAWIAPASWPVPPKR